MTRILPVSVARLALAVGLTCATSPLALAQAADSRPNIMLIVADDLGYSDIGAFGSEIPTPNLDALVADGVQLTNFHVAPTCSPTRAMLLTGTDNHIAGIGSMAEEMLPEQRGRKGYEGFLSEDVVTLPALLRDGGYQTYLSGKWHLGTGEEQRPNAQGFQTSFALLNGAAHHFDQTGLASVVPKALYTVDDQPIDLPADFTYTSEYYTDRMIDQIAAGDSEKPFFAYLSFTAPHWPLQAPAEAIARFKGQYDEGYDAIRSARVERMNALGLLPEGVTPAKAGPRPSWSELDADQRVMEARKMDVYATMVSEMDRHIGRLVSDLKDRGEYDQTIFVFLSDNGAEGNLPEDIMGGSQRDWIRDNFDNSLENIGNKGSYVGYGPSWAAVSQTPYRGAKGFTYEGGTRAPAFITYPGWRDGQQADTFFQVKDIAPTLLDVAGLTHPDAYDGHVVAPMDGSSMLDWLEGRAEIVHPAGQPVCTELFGRIAVWKGDDKLVYSNEPWGTGDFELFDLAKDPTEQNDLSAARPERVTALKADWQDCQQRYGIFWEPDLAQKMVYTNKDFYLSSQAVQ